MFKNILVLKFLAIFLLALMASSCGSDGDTNDSSQIVLENAGTTTSDDTDEAKTSDDTDEAKTSDDTDSGGEIPRDNDFKKEEVKDSNFLSKHLLEVFLILILSLLLLIFIVTSLFHIEKKGAFYGLKRKTLKKKEAPVSKPTSKEPELKILNSDVEGNISYQTESIKNLKNDVSILMKSIKDMNDTFMTLKASLDQKDEEISRYKNGYDATIFKNFLLRFARVDRVIKEYSDDNKIDLKGLKDIQIQMDDALSECDVEMFLPEVGSNFKTTIGVADNPEIRKTSDKSKDSIIAEILRPGYRRKLANNTDNEYQIIIAAKVAIYVCE